MASFVMLMLCATGCGRRNGFGGGPGTRDTGEDIEVVVLEGWARALPREATFGLVAEVSGLRLAVVHGAEDVQLPGADPPSGQLGASSRQSLTIAGYDEDGEFESLEPMLEAVAKDGALEGATGAAAGQSGTVVSGSTTAGLLVGGEPISKGALVGTFVAMPDAAVPWGRFLVPEEGLIVDVAVSLTDGRIAILVGGSKGAETAELWVLDSTGEPIHQHQWGGDDVIWLPDGSLVIHGASSAGRDACAKSGAGGSVVRLDESYVCIASAPVEALPSSCASRDLLAATTEGVVVAGPCTRSLDLALEEQWRQCDAPSNGVAALDDGSIAVVGEGAVRILNARGFIVAQAAGELPSVCDVHRHPAGLAWFGVSDEGRSYFGLARWPHVAL